MRRVLLSLAVLLPVLWQSLGWAQQVEREPVLLVATPDLLDPNFAQTVVLVLFPIGGGPLGVILNRPTPLTLKEVFPDQPRLRERSEALYFGGPVRTTGLMFLFRGSASAEGVFPVFDDLFLSNNGEVLDSLLDSPQDGVQRYFLGYAGWAPVQLEGEIARGGWYVLPADSDTVLNMDPKVMWRELLSRATAIKTWLDVGPRGKAAYCAFRYLIRPTSYNRRWPQTTAGNSTGAAHPLSASSPRRHSSTNASGGNGGLK